MKVPGALLLRSRNRQNGRALLRDYRIALRTAAALFGTAVTLGPHDQTTATTAVASRQTAASSLGFADAIDGVTAASVTLA